MNSAETAYLALPEDNGAQIIINDDVLYRQQEVGKTVVCALYPWSRNECKLSIDVQSKLPLFRATNPAYPHLEMPI